MEPSRSLFQKIHKDPSQKSSWNKHNMFFIYKPFSGFNPSENMLVKLGSSSPDNWGENAKNLWVATTQPINQIMTPPQILVG